MAAWRSTIGLKTPRLRRLRVRAEKKFSTALSHELEVGVKWNTQRGCRTRPVTNFGMLVSGVVVEDCVDNFAGGNFALDGIEKADQLLMGVPLHAAAEHHALQDVEGGEQGGGAVAFVDAMGPAARHATLARQHSRKVPHATAQ